jgi:hypothetical protein
MNSPPIVLNLQKLRNIQKVHGNTLYKYNTCILLMLQHIMNLNSLHLHCFNYHSFMHTLDVVEQEQESPVEQAQVEDTTNHFTEQGKPQCILSSVLDFSAC